MSRLADVGAAAALSTSDPMIIIPGCRRGTGNRQQRIRATVVKLSLGALGSAEGQR